RIHAQRIHVRRIADTIELREWRIAARREPDEAHETIEPPYRFTHRTHCHRSRHRCQSLLEHRILQPQRPSRDWFHLDYTLTIAYRYSYRGRSAASASPMA